jgi:transposase InsO family protein
VSRLTSTLFVNHATQYIHCRHQVLLRIGKTLKTKNEFEGWVKESSRDITQYHADNAPFCAAEFEQDCMNKGQQISYSGVGVHHQNGVAERSIQMVTTWVRAMLLHLMINLPGEAWLELWPMAMDQAIYLWNNLSKRDSHMAPIEVFTGIKFENHNHLQRIHAWGCHVYALDPILQDGKQLPK